MAKLTVLDAASAIDASDLLYAVQGGVSKQLAAAKIMSLAGMYSVMDPTFGAVGNGINDDTPAIQAAIDASPGTVWFPEPPVSYLTTSALTPKSTTQLIGESGFNTRIISNFSGYIVDLPWDGENTSSAVGPLVISNLYIRNTHATGGCIRLSQLHNPILEKLWIKSSYIGIKGEGYLFGGQLRNSFLDGSLAAGSIGLSGHFAVSNCSIIGWDNGIRMSNAWGGMRDSRVEVNNVGLRLGRDADNVLSTCFASHIGGNTFEANDIAIEIDSVYGVQINGAIIHQSPNSPSAGSLYGIKINGAALTRSRIDSVILTGVAANAGFYIGGTPLLAKITCVDSTSWGKDAALNWADLTPFFDQCDQPTS
jgi:hypothetical protein